MLFFGKYFSQEKSLMNHKKSYKKLTVKYIKLKNFHYLIKYL